MEGTNDQVASHLSSGAGVNAAWATTWKEGREGGVKGAIHVHHAAGKVCTTGSDPINLANLLYEMRPLKRPRPLQILPVRPLG